MKFKIRGKNKLKMVVGLLGAFSLFGWGLASAGWVAYVDRPIVELIQPCGKDVKISMSNGSIFKFPGDILDFRNQYALALTSMTTGIVKLKGCTENPPVQFCGAISIPIMNCSWVK